MRQRALDVFPVMPNIAVQSSRPAKRRWQPVSTPQRRQSEPLQRPEGEYTSRRFLWLSGGQGNVDLKGLSASDWALKRLRSNDCRWTRRRNGAASSFTRCTSSGCAPMVYRETVRESCRVRAAIRPSIRSIAKLRALPAPVVTTVGWRPAPSAC